jgi:ADP-ribose pyrophosphatase
VSEPGKVGSRRIYSGRVVNLDVDQVRFPDGQVGELEMIRHSGASAIVPVLSDPDGDDPQILLIRQYRYAADGFLYEIPAGRLEPGEEPAHCARRELQEETGCTATHLEPLFTMYTTPGFTDERIHLFMATGLTRGEAHLEADEFAEVVTFPMSKVLEMVRCNEITDCKTALAVLYVAGFTLGR